MEKFHNILKKIWHLPLWVVSIYAAFLAPNVCIPLLHLPRDVSIIAQLVVGCAGGVAQWWLVRRAVDGFGEAHWNLREQLEAYQELLDNIHDGCYEVDMQGNFRFFNSSLCEILGYSPEALRQANVRSVMGRRAYVAAMRFFAKHYRLEDPVKGYSWEFRRADGKVMHLEASRTIILGENGQPLGFRGIVRNITNRKRTEELMQRAEKLSIVGQLAAGVAHEIRNPLTSLKGFVQLMRSMQDAKEEYLDIMMAELQRIELIIHEFLLLAKPQPITFQPEDLRKVLDDVITLLDTEAMLTNVRICKDYAPVPRILCDASRMKQVFINILQNAIDAMPDGGEVKVQLRANPDGAVRVRIADQGSGIPRERLARIGEPFYTTKEKGTGLGLMVSLRIVEAHRGQMVFQSEEGQGTVVDIILPGVLPDRAESAARQENI